jgi:hypothetical protein
VVRVPIGGTYAEIMKISEYCYVEAVDAETMIFCVDLSLIFSRLIPRWIGSRRSKKKRPKANRRSADMLG